MTSPWMPVAYNPRLIPQYSGSAGGVSPVSPDARYLEELARLAKFRGWLNGYEYYGDSYSNPSQSQIAQSAADARMGVPGWGYGPGASMARMGNAGFPAYQVSGGRGNLTWRF